ncbi:hypothetical protein SAMN04487891_109170 [Flagellimonas taeanensis]|uniref:Chaperone of endosialidase n=1 Tax=Flagellimonas taeanensis TaxID=1005926 RepID=A0A1M7AU69_9FLAO|nr:tail fiber protein [Allomuricauda taeanensis]SFC36061.1 hypothetical protein SAMN04487891_109170 [Allomuricauda taeanensis]SHL46255.1 hypothetical protein SAMN05216293_3543 [Allomuricauda taeanensis]
MKTIIIYLSSFIFLPNMCAQWLENGNSLTTTDIVGIGTSNPDAALHVNGSNGDYILKLNNSIRFRGDGVIEWGTSTNYGILSWDTDEAIIGGKAGKGLSLRADGGEKVRVSTNGFVGIGTTLPDAKLHVYGNNVGSGNVLASIMLGKSNGPEIQAVQESTDDDAQGLSFRVKTSTLAADPNFEALRINRYGDVGIGTATPDAKLAVKGNIHAQEVKVDLNGAVAPDYVFKEGYDLKSLEEVQNYIKEHGHLPNIPSAQEMEENGIQLGEMNMKLLEKIEELTLYTLLQEKMLVKMTERMEQQSKDMEALKLLIKKLHP